MLTSANTSRTGRSVLEAAVGQPIVPFEDLRLTGRLLATKGEEADLVLIQIHFTTNQAVGPPWTRGPGLAPQGPLTLAVAAPQGDQSAPGPLLQVELPAVGEGTPVGAKQVDKKILTQPRIVTRHLLRVGAGDRGEAHE